MKAAPKNRCRRAWPGAALLATLFAHAISAAMVTVTVKTRTGEAAEDSVVVFDPLDAAMPPARHVAVIDQINKRFVPRVNVIRTGTAVSFPNSDSIRHEVYSFSDPHPFKLKLYSGAPRMEITFDKPGMVVLGCNIHDTMVAFIAVVDSPYFAKIPPSGEVRFDLPPGRYRLRVWHPKLSAAFDSQQLIVGGEPLTMPLTVDLNPSPDSAAAWPE